MLRLNSEKEECPLYLDTVDVSRVRRLRTGFRIVVSGSIGEGETDVIHRDAGDRVRAFLPKRVIFESIGREWHDDSLYCRSWGVDVQVDE